MRQFESMCISRVTNAEKKMAHGECASIAMSLTKLQ